MFGANVLVVAAAWFVCVMVWHPQRSGVDAANYRVVWSTPPHTSTDNTPSHVTSDRSIKIVDDDFILDGQPLHIISGSLHYFRIPAAYWLDRLQKIKAAGFNSVATYVEWSYHEPERRQYRFTGDYDVEQFVRTAAAVGLHVLLRPGPYICAERDLGGLPYWLLSKYPNIKLRTTDKDFINETQIWMAKLFEQMTPLLYGNGGPIILVQVENEYGSYSNDMKYKIQMRDIIKHHVGTSALLYTTDGSPEPYPQAGAVPDTLTTVDFGVGYNLNTVFIPLRKVMPKGPLMNSEFYPGWLTHWTEQLQTVDKVRVVNSLRDMLDRKINVNMYIFVGGTNFEFSAGANQNPRFSEYLPDITSYDYDAPISEAGDPTPKYYAIRDLMKQYNPDIRNQTPPVPSPKGAYGEVTFSHQIELLSPEGRDELGKRYQDVSGSILPTFEALEQRAGLVLYEIDLPANITSRLLEIKKPCDRVYVYIDGIFAGLISRSSQITSLPIPSYLHLPGSKLSLLVENQGRINFGGFIHDFKGIRSEVKLGNHVLKGKWKVTGYPLEIIDVEPQNPSQARRGGPALYRGYFRLPQGSERLDTFLDTTGWTKGYVWVNGHNLGRYWPATGPQVTLYVPGVWLHSYPAVNTIEILELEWPSPFLTMNLIDYPILNGSAVIRSINPNDLIFNT